MSRPSRDEREGQQVLARRSWEAYQGTSQAREDRQLRAAIKRALREGKTKKV